MSGAIKNLIGGLTTVIGGEGTVAPTAEQRAGPFGEMLQNKYVAGQARSRAEERKKKRKPMTAGPTMIGQEESLG